MLCVLCYGCEDSQTTTFIKHVDRYLLISIFKLSCKIVFFVPYNGHQNCLDKTLGGEGGGSSKFDEGYWVDTWGLKDIINPHNCLLKKANFSIKTSN